MGGKLLRLSVGGKKQPNSYAYGFLVAEEATEENGGTGTVFSCFEFGANF